MAFCISIVVLILTFHDLEIFLYKKPLTEGERGECKSWLSFLKLSIQKMKIMVSNSITSWKIVWETMQTVTDFIFLDSKITADGDCSHGRKAMTNLDTILKSRGITLLTNVRLVKAMVFPIVMYGLESWNIKKAKHQRTDAFEL